MITVALLLTVCALATLIAHVLRPSIPLWITVLFLIVIHLLITVPLGR